MIKLIDALEILGNEIDRKFSKFIEDDLCELRVKSDEDIARAFYTFMNGKIIILSFFTKKSQKTPKVELEKARNLLKELKCKNGKK